ncbi:hypothetical protein HAX54_036751 [Datura stramonium]|uniref:Uncharacterized protein n=1 Tax=Datura stramonium TaxID=4076 RepID=A0ABS8VHB0_DATST|nr:hypothetical protein [Datura stramonium]
MVSRLWRLRRNKGSPFGGFWQFWREEESAGFRVVRRRQAEQGRRLVGGHFIGRGVSTGVCSTTVVCDLWRDKEEEGVSRWSGWWFSIGVCRRRRDGRRGAQPEMAGTGRTEETKGMGKGAAALVEGK